MGFVFLARLGSVECEDLSVVVVEQSLSVTRREDLLIADISKRLPMV